MITSPTHLPRAYENLIDRLLASPRFGEHFASTWLDGSRYADTNGYSIDGGRQQWIWRDWVIKSFNDNQPFDQFLTEQIAGDLLPSATEQQVVATGFNRNHAITHEGGTIPEENIVNYAADRVKTVTETLLGMTLGCAQCHDHKYDPFTQRDYYRFFASFNTSTTPDLTGTRASMPNPRSPRLPASRRQLRLTRSAASWTPCGRHSPPQFPRPSRGGKTSSAQT